MATETEKPTLEQMELDAARLVKFRGYCRKVRLTLDDLPNNSAYSTLSSIMYQRGQAVSRSKQAISTLSIYARRIEAWIDENGGPRLVPYPPMKTWPDDQRTPYQRFHFKRQQLRDLIDFLDRNSIDADFFIVDLAQYVNTYLAHCYDEYKDNANRHRAREDDLDKLKTLISQVERVIDRFDPIAEMMIRRCYRFAHWHWAIEDEIRINIDFVFELFSAAQLAEKQLRESPRRHKPLEFELACDIAYFFWKRTGIKPSVKETSLFRDLLDTVIEPALGTAPNENRVLGLDVLSKAIAEVIDPVQG